MISIKALETKHHLFFACEKKHWIVVEGQTRLLLIPIKVRKANKPQTFDLMLYYLIKADFSQRNGNKIPLIAACEKVNDKWTFFLYKSVVLCRAGGELTMYQTLTTI